MDGPAEPDDDPAEIESEDEPQDVEAGSGDRADSSFERPVDRFRRTAAGTAIAAGMFGLRDALEGRPEREETVMEVPAPTTPVDDELDVVFDLEHPERARVVIRRPPDGHRPDER